MKLEIGGGKYAVGKGFVNMDIDPRADIVHNLESRPWPIESNSVTEFYSSHCLEHLTFPIQVLQEITRICAVGAHVVIRVPDSTSELSFVHDHKHCLSEACMENTLIHFETDNWPVDGKRLKMVQINKRPCPIWFPRARANPLFAAWSDHDIMTWIPRTCHENEFVLRVEQWK